MKKRLRKKKHLKEFAEYGIQMIYQGSVADSHINDFLAKVEAKGLVCGGSWNKDGGDMFVELLGHEPVFLNDFKQWLLDSGFLVQTWTVRDAWHGWR